MGNTTARTEGKRESVVYLNPEGMMREKRADPLDELWMNAIDIQLDATIVVVYRIKSSGEVKEDNIHWLTRIHKLNAPVPELTNRCPQRNA